MADKRYSYKGMVKFLFNVWRLLIALILFALLFYAGMITGMYRESSIQSDIHRKTMQTETQVKELSGRVAAIEAIVRRK